MTREESAKWAALLQAQADGKQLEYKTVFGSYVPAELGRSDLEHGSADNWRIAPDLPPKPSQRIMDVIAKFGCEIDRIGHFRIGDLILTPGCFSASQPNAYEDVGSDVMFVWEADRDQGEDVMDAQYIILRRRVPQVKPWTLSTVPMPLVTRCKGTGILHVAVLADENGVAMHAYNEPYRVRFVAYESLLEADEQRDGSPCGEVSK